MTTATAPTDRLAPTIPLGTRLAGFSHLLRLAWRRDRILVPSSVLGLVVLSVGSAQATLALYPDDASAAAGLAGILTNPSVIAMYGPLASQTADALAVFKTVMMGAFLIAVLGFVVVRRHTRTEEDEGRLELLGSGVVGRWSPLAAAVTLATVAVVAASALSAAGLAALGLDAGRQRGLRGRRGSRPGWRPSGSAPWPCSSRPRPRGAAGLGFGFLAATYALRAVADSADAGTVTHALGWLSPLGWAGRVEAYGANRQWVLAARAGHARRGRGHRRGDARPARPGGRRSSRPATVRRRAGRLLSGAVGPRDPAGPGHGHRVDHRASRSPASSSVRSWARSPTSPTTR